MLPNLELYLLTHQDKLQESRRNYYLASLSPSLLGQWVQRMTQMRSLLFFW